MKARPLKKSLNANKDTENKQIIKTLLSEKQPLSRRRFNELTGLELPTLCRALFNLVHKSKVLEVAQIRPCPTTKKRVYHYYFKSVQSPDLFNGGQNA